jgi:serine phosphatase RsbU (regulator of sigma subunit)
MKVLVVEQNQSGRQRLSGMLAHDGHQVEEADDAVKALALFSRVNPDMVFIHSDLGDAGPLLSHQIKQQNPHHFVPIVFVSPVADEMALCKFMEGHADDFIEDSMNPISLRAKIMSIARTTHLYNEFESSRLKTEREIKLARHMFDSLIRNRRQDVAQLNSWTWAAGHFSGDMVIYEKNSRGDLWIMLGDFTGHGLAAAVGAIPAADVFFVMVEMGQDIGLIASAINKKLYGMLPTGHFCSACLISVEFSKSLITIFNGGLPSMRLISGQGEVLARPPSMNLPLGILSPEEFQPRVETLSPRAGESLVMYSDGLTEAINPAGEMFGEDRLDQILAQAGKGEPLIEIIKKELIAFMNGLEPLDDVSLITLSIE